MKEIAHILGAPLENCYRYLTGKDDVEKFYATAVSYGFRQRKITESEPDYCIDDLRKILPIILY